MKIQIPTITYLSIQPIIVDSENNQNIDNSNFLRIKN